MLGQRQRRMQRLCACALSCILDVYGQAVEIEGIFVEITTEGFAANIERFRLIEED